MITGYRLQRRLRNGDRAGADDNPAGDVPLFGYAKGERGLSHRRRRFSERDDPVVRARDA